MIDYESHFRQRGLTQYTLDGAINSKGWNASTVRILFLLKENYGYKEYDVMSLQDYAHGWLDANNKTYVRSATLAAAIQIGIQRCCPLSQDELNNTMQDRSLLHTTLNKIAVVNIKKHSGESTSNDAEIRVESGLNSSLLKAQITELSPTIIVAGGTVCWHSLIHDIGLFAVASDCQKFETAICNRTVLCNSYHPAARKKVQFDIDRLHRAILSAHKEV